MVITVINGEVGAIKRYSPGTTTIITTTTTCTLVDIKETAVEEAKEPIKEEVMEVEHPRMGAKSVEENTATPTETTAIPAATAALQDPTTSWMLPSIT